MKLYLDTNVWIDYFDSSRANHANAIELFKRIKEGRHVIVISAAHYIDFNNTEYARDFKTYKDALFRAGLCIGVKYSSEQFQVASRHNEYLKKGFADCLHLIVARDYGSWPVSRDQHWFDIGESLGIMVYDYEAVFDVI